MLFIRILVLTFVKKLPLILFSALLGGTAGYVFESIGMGLSISIFIFISLYWFVIGPSHAATKRRLKRLVELDILVDTLILPTSPDSHQFTHKEWCDGRGIFDRFIDNYKTQIVNNGILFYCMDMPYLPLYILPWTKINDISNNTKLIDEEDFDELNNIYDITIINGDHILLPIPKEAISQWKNLSGQP